MITSVVTMTSMLVTVAMLVVAAVSDFRKMQIENYIPITIICCFAVVYTIDTTMSDNMPLLHNWWSPIIAIVVAFVLTFVLFTVGLIGGGDSKLVVAISPWLGLQGMIAFVFYMSLAGGALALLAITVRGKKFLKPLAQQLGNKSWPSALLSGKNAIPYGIAILVGALGAFWYIELPQNIINQVYTNN